MSAADPKHPPILIVVSVPFTPGGPLDTLSKLVVFRAWADARRWSA